MLRILKQDCKKKKAEEKARKDRRNKIIVFGIKENQTTSYKSKGQTN